MPAQPGFAVGLDSCQERVAGARRLRAASG